MFKNRRPNSRASFPRTPNKRNDKPRGTFNKGQWLCDCNPPIPAEHFQVKKEGKNKGRWFYTCQKHEGERCGFFLWEDDAKPRMDSAVLNNSTTERSFDVKKEVETPQQGKKRKLPWEQSGERQNSNVTEDVDFGMSDEGEEALSQVAIRQETIQAPETPRKAQKIAPFETPSFKVRGAVDQDVIRNGLPTPGTTPHVTRKADVLPESGLDTPTPTRMRDALSITPGEDALSDKTFKLLALFDLQLDTRASIALRQLLESEARRYQGIAKGRDAARAAIQIRDARIAELTGRIEQLVQENESNKALLKHLRRSRMD